MPIQDTNKANPVPGKISAVEQTSSFNTVTSAKGKVSIEQAPEVTYSADGQYVDYGKPGAKPSQGSTDSANPKDGMTGLANSKMHKGNY